MNHVRGGWNACITFVFRISSRLLSLWVAHQVLEFLPGNVRRQFNFKRLLVQMGHSSVVDGRVVSAVVRDVVVLWLSILSLSGSHLLRNRLA